jgi:hypothetical protein
MMHHLQFRLFYVRNRSRTPDKLPPHFGLLSVVRSGGKGVACKGRGWFKGRIQF